MMLHALEIYAQGILIILVILCAVFIIENFIL